MTVSTALERPKQGSVPASLVGAPALTMTARGFAADAEAAKSINDWLAQSQARVIHIFGNIAPQRVHAAPGEPLANGNRPESKWPPSTDVALPIGA